MEEIQNIIEPVVNASEKVLNRARQCIYGTAIKVFLVLYAAFAAPKLPPTLVNLADNTLVRIIFAFVIVLTATRSFYCYSYCYCFYHHPSNQQI